MLCRESQLLEQIESLKAEVRFWRDAAGSVVDGRIRAQLMTAFRLSRAEAWIVAALYALKGGALTLARMEDEMPGRGDHVAERTSNSCEVLLCKTRRKIGPDAIENIRGVGYRLTTKGIRLCEAALDPIREEITCSRH